MAEFPSLQAKRHTRVVVLLEKTSPLIAKPPDEVVQTACQILDVSTEYNLLVNQKRQYNNAVVFDLFHSPYDFVTAHHKANIPVIHVDFYPVHYSYKTPTDEFRNMINGQIARMHNLNGWNVRPPFSEQEASPDPRLFTPRDASLL